MFSSPPSDGKSETDGCSGSSTRTPPPCLASFSTFPAERNALPPFDCLWRPRESLPQARQPNSASVSAQGIGQPTHTGNGDNLDGIRPFGTPEPADADAAAPPTRGRCEPPATPGRVCTAAAVRYDPREDECTRVAAWQGQDCTPLADCRGGVHDARPVGMRIDGADAASGRPTDRGRFGRRVARRGPR